MRRRAGPSGDQSRRLARRSRIGLFEVNSRQGASRDFQIGPHGHGGLVLAARQVELPGRGQQIAQVCVADRVAAGLAQERQGFLGPSRCGQRQAEVDLDPLVLGGEAARPSSSARSASAHRPWR